MKHFFYSISPLAVSNMSYKLELIQFLFDIHEVVSLIIWFEVYDSWLHWWNGNRLTYILSLEHTYTQQSELCSNPKLTPADILNDEGFNTPPEYKTRTWQTLCCQIVVKALSKLLVIKNLKQKNLLNLIQYIKMSFF